MKKKFLAQDTSSFSKIIEKKCYCVDKTHLIFKMASEDSDVASNYFLSRPRRFGKSLLIDTIKCLFEGKKELFKDLYIYDKWDFDKNTHPVIRLDFSKGEYCKVDDLKNFLDDILHELEDQHQIPNVKSSSRHAFRLTRIIQKLYSSHNKQVVVLIDEYDAPITAH